MGHRLRNLHHGAGIAYRLHLVEFRDTMQSFKRSGRMIRHHHPLLRPGNRVPEAHADHESVELRLRQRIGSFKLNRVLRGDNDERLLQMMRLPVHRHLPLAHRLQQCGLHFRIGTVDFVGDHDIGENRARMERKGLRGARIHVHAEQIARQQIRSELDPPYRPADCRSQSPRQRGFTDSRNIFEQHVTAGGEGQNRRFHRLARAYKHRVQRVGHGMQHVPRL